VKAKNQRKKLVEEVMKNRKSIRKVFVLVVMLSLTWAHWGIAAQTYTISVNQFVENPAPDAVRKGLHPGLFQRAEYPGELYFTVHNVQANMGTQSGGGCDFFPPIIPLSRPWNPSLSSEFRKKCRSLPLIWIQRMVWQQREARE
jgi:hypothetical protein